MIRDKKKVKAWINSTIIAEGFVLEHLSFVFCNDKFLLKLNNKYLQHSTFTDIITFDLSEKKMLINGELYISIDRVKDNAKNFKTTFTNELHRVMIHGVLHLCGHKDKSTEHQTQMRALEDHYLSKLRLS